MVTKKDTLEALNSLRDLFASPKSWTQNAHARSSEGHMRASWHEDATCYCLIGGIAKVSNLRPGDSVHASPLADKLYNLLCAVANIPYGTLAVWNDMQSRSVKDIRKLIDKTIHFVEEGEVEI